MSKEIFDKAIEFTLLWEGWKSSDPWGGETIWGVAYKYHPEAVEKMRNMSMAEAREYSKQFYYSEYWQPASCDDFRQSTAIVLFDSSVNPGLHRAIQFLQRAINVFDDGVIGTKTMSATENLSDIHTALLMIAQRRMYYQDKVIENPAKAIDLKGWLNRCDDLEKYIRE